MFVEQTKKVLYWNELYLSMENDEMFESLKREIKSLPDNLREKCIETLIKIIKNSDIENGTIKFNLPFPYEVDVLIDLKSGKPKLGMKGFKVAQYMRDELKHEYRIIDIGSVVSDDGIHILVSKAIRDDDKVKEILIYVGPYLKTIKSEGIRLTFKNTIEIENLIGILRSSILELRPEIKGDIDFKKEEFIKELKSSKVLLHIVRLVLKSRYYEFTFDDLWKELGYGSRQAVQNQISKYVKKGFIMKKGMIGKKRVYTLTIPRQVLEQWMKEWVGLD